MDLIKEEDGSREFFEDLKKNLHVYADYDGKFKHRNEQIIKYEYFNLKEKLVEKKKEANDFMNHDKENQSIYIIINLILLIKDL